MLYHSNFKDINDKNYKVRITTNGDASKSKEIVLGTPAFVTEVETGDSNLYKPIKGQTATVKLVTNDYLFDLYSSAAQQNKVELLDNNNKLIWGGYITPNLYQQGYENEVEEIEVEATDAISSLQYMPYTPVGSKKDIVSFWAILNHIIKKCGIYKTFYFSNAMRQYESSTTPLINISRISEQNFFDEDDEAMMMRDVLKEICKYFSVTCIAVGDSVFFIDYDALKIGHNTYYKYNIDSSAYTTVTISQSLDISGNDYSENGGTLTLGETYNKVTLKDSLYSFDSVIPSIWDEKHLTNYGATVSEEDNDWNYVRVIDEDGVAGKHKLFVKYFKNDNYKSFYYEKGTLKPFNLTFMDYSNTQNFVGATIMKGCFKKSEGENINDVYYDVDYTDYLLLHNHNSNSTKIYEGLKITDDVGLPVFEMSIDNVNPAFLGGDGCYLIIKGNFIYMDRESDMYIMQDYQNKKDNFNSSELWIKAKLQIGNQFWTGGDWTTQEVCFKLPFHDNGQNDHCINQNFPIKNTVKWNMGINEDGYAIKLPNYSIINGTPKFTLYQPHKLDEQYRCDAVFLSNFDIQAVVANFEKTDERQTDTEYSNVINEDWVNEFQCEDFKICTWDNKEANFSCVVSGYLDKYLDTVYHVMNGEMLRTEEHHIWKHVTQFSKPAAQLELNLKCGIEPYSTLTDKWLPDRTFVVDSQTIDFENNQTNIKIIEKI